MLSGVENIKNSKSRFVRISSEDKVSGTNNKFVVNLESSGGAIDNVKGFIVHSAQVPNIFYNVPEYKNELQVTKQTGNVVYTIFIAPNQYTVSDFLAQLKSQIDAFIFPDTASVALDPFGKIVFSWSGDAYAFTEANREATTMRDIIGLTESDAQGIFYTAQNMSAPVNLIGETECYIHSRVLCPSNLVEANGAFSVVDKINLDEPYGSMCYTNYNNDTTHMMRYFPYESRKTLRTVDINLRTRTGELLELPDNFTFSMMIKIFYS